MKKATTQLMGILNATPDSFYAPSRTDSCETAIARGIRMAAEGADLIDIGGESTRPGAALIPEQEEISRVIPVIEGLKKHLSIPISIDTSKPSVAEVAIKAGASFLNDVTGFSSPRMIELAAESQIDVCVMHMQGTPETMQRQPHYPEGVVPHLLAWFEQRLELLLQRGIRQEKIIIDPGIGFGKTIADNMQIIQNLGEFKKLGFRILLGISRKSFMGKILNLPSHDLLSATLALNAVALTKGASILRVHDVAEHRALIDIVEALQS